MKSHFLWVGEGRRWTLGRRGTAAIVYAGALVSGGSIADATTVPDDTAPGSSESPGAVDGPAFCTDYLGTLELFNDEDGPDPELAAAGLAAMRDSAPPDIADAATAVADAATAELGGDSEATSTPEFGAALSDIDNWTFDNCSFDAKVDVAAVDWAFGGIPLELAAGSAAFRVTNIGEEMHEMGILRKLDGVTLSWEEIMPIVAESFVNETDDAEQYVEDVGHAWVPTSENSAVAFAELVPGEYAAFCMLPVGTDPGHVRGGHGGTRRPGVRGALAARDVAGVHGRRGRLNRGAPGTVS